jgi:hypothetical protein
VNLIVVIQNLRSRRLMKRRQKWKQTGQAMLSLAIMAACGPAARHAPVGPDGGVADRIVIESPHFDEPPPPSWRGLSCPGGPLYAVAKPGGTLSDGTANLVFQVKSYPRGGDGAAGGNPIPGVIVAFFARIGEEHEDTLTLGRRWAGPVDSLGVVILNVRAGIYRTRVSMIGWKSGELVLRARPNREDSVVVYMDRAAIC